MYPLNEAQLDHLALSITLSTSAQATITPAPAHASRIDLTGGAGVGAGDQTNATSKKTRVEAMGRVEIDLTGDNDEIVMKDTCMTRGGGGTLAKSVVSGSRNGATRKGGAGGKTRAGNDVGGGQSQGKRTRGNTKKENSKILIGRGERGVGGEMLEGGDGGGGCASPAAVASSPSAGYLWAISEASLVFLRACEREKGLELRVPADSADASIQLASVAGQLLRSYLYELVVDTEGESCERQEVVCVGGGQQDDQLLRDIEGIRDWGKAYLRQLDPGYHLCVCVWCGVDAMEKNRQYAECVPLLRLILATPFLQTRRGRMFNRLALDLQHLAQETSNATLHTEALAVCDKALQDLSVTGGDRLTLLKRRDRLLLTVGKSDASSSSMSKKKKKPKRQDGYISDSVSSDDFRDERKAMEGKAGKKGRSSNIKDEEEVTQKTRGKGGRKMDGKGKGGGARTSGGVGGGCDVAERIGNAELVLLGFLSVEKEGGKGGGGGGVGRFLSAFGGGEGQWPDDVIEGTRLGDKVVGRKSRFAGL